MGSIKLCVAFLFAMTVVFSSMNGAESQTQTILAVLKAQFPVMYNYVMDNPGLANDLNNPTDIYTVFAPVDAAFNGSHVPVNTTNPMIFYHVAKGRVTPADLSYGAAIPTLLYPPPLANHSQVLIVGRTGNSIKPINGTITTLNGVIVNSSQTAVNGIVYTINGLLIPTTKYVEELVLGYPILSSLVNLAQVDLKLHPLTLFAPTNEAFAALPWYLTNYLSMNTSMSNSDLKNILLYHGIGTTPVYTGDLSNGQSVTFNTLLSGNSLTIVKPANFPQSEVYVEDYNGNASIVNPDVLALNGVLHGIDDVLLPGSNQFSFTLEKVIMSLGATKFLDAVRSRGLASYLLNDTAKRSLFVPTNDAIGNMNMSYDALLYHAIPNSFDTHDLVNAYLLQSLLALPGLDGHSQVLKFAFQVNTSTDILLINGNNVVLNQTNTLNTPNINYVYLIDSVLSVPGLVTDVLRANDYSIFADAIETTDLPWIANSSLTVFAPTDDAFNMLPPGALGYLMNSNYSGDLLTTILYSHIVEDPNAIYYSTVIPVGTTVLDTLSPGSPAVVRKTNNNITVNGAAVLYPDNAAANGVVHGINRVLIPAGVSFSVQNVLEGLGNFSRLLGYLTETGLISSLNSTTLTIFAPDDDAFDQVDDLDALTSNTTRLTEVLKAHIVYSNVSMLSPNESLSTASGQSIFVLSPDEVELKNDKGETLGSSANVGTVTYGRNGYAYGINRVLGVEQSTGGGGLKKWQLALIVIGSVIGGLLLLVLVIAVLYFVYHMFFKDKNGYRKIND